MIFSLRGTTAIHRALVVCAFSLAALFAQSCAPKITIAVENSGRASCDFSVTFDNDTMALLGSLYAADGSAPKDPNALELFDTAAIKRAFTNSGFEEVTVSTNRASSLNVHFASANVNDIFYRIPSAMYEETSNKMKRLRWIISPETARLLLDIFPQDSSGYMALFMAPIITGEQMQSKEYIDLIAGVYGNTAAELLKKSVFTINFAMPSQVMVRAAPKEVTVDVNGKNLSLTMPLAELLCVTGRLSFEIQWM